ncbi:MAG: malto-oligosyltrehalose synthase [Actinomycetia bacterium]|nr:malto-oligosyltrehalose synthase [Actinomycetes bacterium]
MIPRSTYRLQLRPGFGFDEAAAVADYVADLGSTHVYSSPYLQAAPGSTHGYDVVDHSKVNDELGGAEAHARFCATLGRLGLGQVLDVVPNHMAVTPENEWWTDVLENGPSSRYASYFDVDWDPPERKLRNTVLLPVLGDHYGRVLEAGELAVERRGGAFVLRYFEHGYPIAPRTYDLVLGLAAVATDDDDLAFLAGAFGDLPHAWLTDRVSVVARHRDKEVLKRQLDRLLAERPELADAVDAAVVAVNADADLLDSLLDRQNYRLAHWRVAGEELDYRRFFDINDLAGLRMEDDAVFDDTHALVVEWLRTGVLDGLRIDHPDGLLDPLGYFERLRAASPEGWIVVEKILEPGEALPETWPVDGTTGYDFLNLVGGLFVDPAGEGPLTEAYGAFAGEPTDYEAVVHEAEHLVVDQVLAADMSRLTNLFVQVTEMERRYRDFTRPELAAVLGEAAVCFPVYRTYVRPGAPVSPADERTITVALDDARARRADLDPELFELLGRVLRGELDGPARELCLRFQQTTGPVMAKGVEDTTFYRFNRLASLNEVGGDPSRFGVDVATFHEAMATTSWPRAMLASSTHDTKRSEDVRARIALLSEVPDEFAAAAGRWTQVHEPPDRNLAWLLFQVLVGAHPLPLDRALAYVEKATKEAKQHTSWTDPVPEYDGAVRAWVEALCADDALLADLDGFVAPLVDPGWSNALAAQLVKLTAPGVPDVYQGTELWDLSLVDPDNRRPVDYDLRRKLLAELDGMTPAEAWARRDEGLPKLLLTRQALRARPEGTYRPLAAHGAAAAHVVAFARGDRLATVVTRLPITLARVGGWRDTTVDLPWAEGVPVADLLRDLPAALVERP